MLDTLSALSLPLVPTELPLTHQEALQRIERARFCFHPIHGTVRFPQTQLSPFQVMAEWLSCESHRHTLLQYMKLHRLTCTLLEGAHGSMLTCIHPHHGAMRWFIP